MSGQSSSASPHVLSLRTCIPPRARRLFICSHLGTHVSLTTASLACLTQGLAKIGPLQAIKLDLAGRFLSGWQMVAVTPLPVIPAAKQACLLRSRPQPTPSHDLSRPDGLVPDDDLARKVRVVSQVVARIDEVFSAKTGSKTHPIALSMKGCECVDKGMIARCSGKGKELVGHREDRWAVCERREERESGYDVEVAGRGPRATVGYGIAGGCGTAESGLRPR